MQDTVSRPSPNARASRGRADTSETGDFLMMSFEPGEEGTPVRLIGSYPNRSLLITAPEVDGRLLFVKEGQVFHFRSFYAQAVYAFSTTIQKVCFTPFPYVHLDWPRPSTIERTVVRRSRRVDVKIPCAVYWDLDGKNYTHNGTIRNLSTNGAELHMSRSIPERGTNTRLAFRLQVAGMTFLVECRMKVMRHQLIPGKEDTTIDQYGVELLEVPQESLLALHGYVQETAVTRLETPIYAQTPP